MSKKLVPKANYSFSASGKQITFVSFTELTDIEQILFIENITDNIIIYMPQAEEYSTYGGTLSTNVLTLNYDTSAMGDTDSLQIFIDVPKNENASIVTIEDSEGDEFKFDTSGRNTSKIQDSNGDELAISVTGQASVLADQNGTWNLNNVSGTISLPTGASTSTLQTSGNALLTNIDNKLVTGTVIGDVNAAQKGTWNLNNISGTISLPTGAATESTLTLIKSKTDNLDVLLSTRATETTLSGVKTQTDKLTFNATRLTAFADINGITPVNTRMPVTMYDSTGIQADLSTNGDQYVTPRDSSGNEIQFTAGGSQFMSIKDSDGHEADVSGTSGSLFVTIVDSTGKEALVTTSGELRVVNPPPEAPIGTQSITQTAYGDVSTITDTIWVIPNGSTLVVQRFSASGASSVQGSVCVLYYDPNGDLSVLTPISVIHVDGNSDEKDLNSTYTGNGVRRIVMRRERLNGGAKSLFASWIGYY